MNTPHQHQQSVLSTSCLEAHLLGDAQVNTLAVPMTEKALIDMSGAPPAEKVSDRPRLFMRGLIPARTFARIPSLTAGLRGKARQRAIETLAAKYCTPSRSQSQSSRLFEILGIRRFDVIIDDDN